MFKYGKRLSSDRVETIRRVSRHVYPSHANPTWHRLVTTSPGNESRLTLGKADDQHEREADRLADRVLRMPAQAIEPVAVQGGNRASVVQRMCSECEDKLRRVPLKREDEEQEEAPLARAKSVEGGASGETSLPPKTVERIEAFKGSGSTLSEAARGYFEPRFGTDFSQVRIHTGTNAADAAHAVQAKAFTVGDNIVFGGGQYQPESQNGRRLLAHELTHVLQRRSGALSRDRIQRTRTVYMCSKSLDTSPVGTHALFRVGGSGTGNPSLSLQPIDQGDDCWQGIPDRNYPSDFNAAATCQATNITESCLDNQFASYPRGRYCTWGPNSNTFVGHVAKQCGLSNPDPAGWNPGLGASPPTSGTYAPSKWATLVVCTSKNCARGEDGRTRTVRPQCEPRYLGDGSYIGRDCMRHAPRPQI